MKGTTTHHHLNNITNNLGGGDVSSRYGGSFEVVGKGNSIDLDEEIVPSSTEDSRQMSDVPYKIGESEVLVINGSEDDIESLDDGNSIHTNFGLEHIIDDEEIFFSDSATINHDGRSTAPSISSSTSLETSSQVQTITNPTNESIPSMFMINDLKNRDSMIIQNRGENGVLFPPHQFRRPTNDYFTHPYYKQRVKNHQSNLSFAKVYEEKSRQRLKRDGLPKEEGHLIGGVPIKSEMKREVVSYNKFRRKGSSSQPTNSSTIRVASSMTSSPSSRNSLRQNKISSQNPTLHFKSRRRVHRPRRTLGRVYVNKQRANVDHSSLMIQSKSTKKKKK